MILALMLAMQLATQIGGTDEDPVWTNGIYTWTGNPWCAELGIFPKAGLMTNDDGGLIDTSTVGACRNMVRAVSGIVPSAPGGLTVQ